MSEYIVDGAVPNHTVRVEDEREVYWHMTHLPVREEIVRCRDCVNFDPNYTDGAFFDETVCWAWDNGHDYPHYTVPDGFCYRGERRDA